MEGCPAPTHLESASCAARKGKRCKIRLELQLRGAGMRLSLYISTSYGDAPGILPGELDKIETKTARKRGAGLLPHPNFKSLYNQVTLAVQR